MERIEQVGMAAVALRHPIRVRALEAMHLHREISATMFVNEQMGKDLEALQGRPHQQQVSSVDYHLHALEKMNCIYRTRREKRRGGWENFYRSSAVAYFSDEEWAELSLGQRRAISRVVAQGFIVQVEGALLAKTFDSRTDRWLLWERFDLDETGWEELSDGIRAFYADVKEIHASAKERLGNAGEDAKRIWTTFGVASFESPEMPGPTVPGSDGDAPDDQE